MASVSDWADRILQLVEHDGARVSRIRLITVNDGQTWETWYPPFGTVDEFVDSVNTYCRSLEQEFPTRQVPIALVAESDEHEVLSQLPMRIVGKAKVGNLDAMQAANSAALDSLALTIEKLMQLTNTQLDAARRSQDVMNDTMQQQYQLIRLYRERESLGPDEAPSAIAEALKEHLPSMLEMARALIERK